MYLVVTVPNAIDPTISITAPRLITDDVQQALEAVRKAITDEYADFVEMVIIYEMVQGKGYELTDSKRRSDASDSKNCIVAFVVWREITTRKWIAKCYASRDNRDPDLFKDCNQSFSVK